MTYPQKLIIWDYLRRRKWALILIGTLHLGVVILSGWTGVCLLFITGFGSGILLLAELSQIRGGHGRVLLTQPVTASELSHCWRVVGFTVPVVAGFVILVFGTLMSVIFGFRHISVQGFVIAATEQTLFLGTIFCAAFRIPLWVASEHYAGYRLLDHVFAVLACVLIGVLGIVMVPSIQNWKEFGAIGAIIAMILAAVTITVWFKSKAWISRRLDNPGSALRSRKSTRSGAVASSQGFGGIAYLLLRRAIMQALISIIAVIGLSWVWKFTDAPSRSYDMLYMYIAILVGSDMKAWLPHLRSLRTLPLSRRSLVHLLVFWSPACITIFYAIASRFVFFICGNFAIVWHWDSAFLAAVLPTLFLPLLLRFGIKWWMMTFMPLFILPVLLTNLHANWLLVLVVGVAVLAFVWIVTYRLLATPHPWRAGAFKPSKRR